MRIGVDVGGTFTKAVAIDIGTGKVVARAMVPTTHRDTDGPAAGVVEVVGAVARTVGPEYVDLVTHSTTQAVNALLEGDVGLVGVLGMGREPDVRKASKRTRLADVELSPGKRLATVHEFLDITHGLDDTALGAALDRLEGHEVRAVCVAEAFAPDGAEAERHAVDAAAARGLPACGSSEMTGLYGLELRAVTAALNASILPIALRTADHVDAGVARAGVRAPVMVMRGDGGAIDTAGFRREPARTLYSGPAASVAGVLRFSRLRDGVVVEVGGTSTNVAAVRDGRPALSYVRVASHATALRALDVRVIGVAGGSMLRARRGRVHGVGPRSAHIAGLPYTCYLAADRLVGATAEVVAPVPGDPVQYVVLRLRDGTGAALTNTCAALRLGIIEPGDYAAHEAHVDATITGFDAAGALLRLSGEEVARRMLVASAQAVGELVSAVSTEYELRKPRIVAVGGGAGGLGRFVAQTLGLECEVPAGAEVISSIGDALSFIRIERERTVVGERHAEAAALADAVEEACVAAGAAPASVIVRIEFDEERSTLRAVATGAVGLESGALPGRQPIASSDAASIAAEHGLATPRAVGTFWVATGSANGSAAAPNDSADTEVLVLDRYGDPVANGRGGVIYLDTTEAADNVAGLVQRATRRVGPVIVRPTVWLLHGSRLESLAPDSASASCGVVAANGGRGAAVVLRD